MTLPEPDERWVLHYGTCILCGHALMDHHEAHLRCQVRTKRRWWSRAVQCACEMRLPRGAR